MQSTLIAKPRYCLINQTTIKGKTSHTILPGSSKRSKLTCSASHNIAVLSGDGIGPEITAVALDVLKAAGSLYGEEFEFKEALIGGAAIDATGDPYPAETEAICKASDAVLLAAIGG